MNLRCVLSCLLLTIAVSGAPESRADQVRKALQARQEGRLEASIELYRDALSALSIDPESWWYQGLNYYDLDRFAEAEEAFRKVTEQASNNGGATTLLGLCEFQNGRYRDAFAHIVIGKQYGIPEGSELDRVAQ